MSLPARGLAVLVGSAALAAVLNAPAAANPPGSSMRMSGMMNMPSMSRSGFTGGVGMMSYPQMLGMRAYSQPPAAMPPGGSGYGSPQMRSYAQPYGSGDGYNQSAPASYGKEESPKDAANSRLLALRRFGGGLDWPIALRYLTRDDDGKELRERIDSRFEQLVNQKQAATAKSELLRDLSGDVEKVHKQFVRLGEDHPMTRVQVQDARGFLSKVRDALKEPTAPSEVSTYR